jgi:ABC-type nitrate/sulfonate/bicarbonate transport system substrate-binding protein
VANIKSHVLGAIPVLKRAGVALLVIMILLLTACGSSSKSGGASLTHVKLALDWIPNTNHTGIYVAEKQGLYQQQGIDVSLTPYGSVYPETLVATGQADFAVSFEESVTIDRAQGQPIVSIAAVMQHDTSAFAVLKSSGITRPAQLVGKRFASGGDPAEKAVIDLMEKADGVVNPSYQSTQVDNADVTALLSGHFDFVWIYKGVEGIQEQDKGVGLNLFSLQDYGLPDFYSPVLITSEQMIKQHPDVVRRFLAATAQGYTFAAQHPDQATDLLIQGAGGQSKTLFDTRQVANDSQTYQSSQYIADAKCWGVQKADVWTGFPRLLYQNGVLKDANDKTLTSEPDYNAMFTNSYLPSC